MYALQELQPGLEKVYFTLQEELMKPQVQLNFTPNQKIDNLVLQPAIAAPQQQIAEVLLTAVKLPAPARWNVDPGLGRRQTADAIAGNIGRAIFGYAFSHPFAVEGKNEFKLRPTLFDVPPVIWNTLYGEYRRALARADLDAVEAAALRRRFRDALGGRIAFMATGGAPSDEGVRRTMETLFGVPMSEGYGTTETGFIARNGRLLPGIEYRLLDRPELGFTAADRPLPRGELAVRTPRSAARYLDSRAGADEEFTADGFFRTGDLVELGPGRRVRVVGRAKLTFKLAGAELVSPEELERVYARSDGVEQIWITAAPGAARVVAVGGKFHGVKEWCAARCGSGAGKSRSSSWWRPA